jgi:hypothetical protein
LKSFTIKQAGGENGTKHFASPDHFSLTKYSLPIMLLWASMNRLYIFDLAVTTQKNVPEAIKVFAKAGLYHVASTMCKQRQRFGPQRSMFSFSA